MSKPKDAPKGVDRRAVMRGALAVGGASILGGVAAMPQTGVISEREWATVPELGLTQVQVVELRQAFENTLVANMGCDVIDQPPGE